jgi:D-ribose pyranose/furanose isomerase RbsD
MLLGRDFLVLGAALLSLGCAGMKDEQTWHGAVDRQAGQLGYRNWIVISEASFPAQSRPGVRQVTASADIPEVLDYVLKALEQTENVRPQIYLPRELRSLENDFAPGVDELRKRLQTSIHGHETTELEQQSLLTLLEDANRSFDVLVIRTTTALPYSSVFIELQPGYWDVDSETRLRERIERERLQKSCDRSKIVHSPRVSRKEEELRQEREDAWVGDAVLALFARQFVLRERNSMDGEWFTRLTSNDFLSAFGNPTRVEAGIGKIYLQGGLAAAFTWMDAELVPLFRKQIAKKG